MIGNHVVNLELSRRLKELGYPQKKSIFYWVDHNKYGEFLTFMPKGTSLKEFEDYWYAAPTATELLEYMPISIKVFEENNYLKILKSTIGDYQVEYSRNGYAFSCLEHEESLSNTLAKMLIYLIENGLYDEKNST